MATETVRPNGDVTTNWDGSTEGTYYEAIDEGAGAALCDGDNIYENSPASQHCRFDMTNPSFAGTCTAIRIWVRAESGDESENDVIRIRLYDGAAEIGTYKDVVLAYGEGDYWTAQWAGLSLSAVNLADFRVDIEAIGDAPMKVCTLDAEITYTPPAELLDINIGDTWKESTEVKINIGDDWKAVTEMKINIGNVWKTIF